MTILLGLDTETTGLLGDDGKPGEQRIIELAMTFWEWEKRRHIGSKVWRINPLRSITPKAQEVHGISLADLAGSPTWELVAPEIVKFMNKGDIIIAHNGDNFDLPFICWELMRVKQPVPDVNHYDTMLNGRWATANGKVPTLGELCFALDVDYDPEKAHSALYDINVMMDALFKGIDLGFFNISHLIEQKKEAA